MNLDSTPIDFSNARLSFHKACAQGNLSVVKSYFGQQGFDMNAESIGFHRACTKGKLNIVQFLVEQGFDINSHDVFGKTGFHLACCSGKLNVVQFFCQQGFNMNIGDNNGSTGFHWACCKGKLNVVQFLLQAGFNMNAVANVGSTGFHVACRCGHLNIVQFLIQHGFDWNVVDNDGTTGFHGACSDGNLNVVQFLLQRGFKNINKVDSNGKTGLEWLIHQRYRINDNENLILCVLLLIEAGAECSKIDVFEELIIALQNRIIEITLIKEIIFEKWTGRIARVVTDFTMDSFTNTSLQNLSQLLD